eukprot:scaffold296353_cov42-Prasinocladus_malaysianus.AAC.1
MKLYSSPDAGLNQLKAVAARIPIVLVSEVGSRKDVWSAISSGAADVVSRPLSRPKLQTLWQHVVRRQGPVPSAAMQPVAFRPPMAAGLIHPQQIVPAAPDATMRKPEAKSVPASAQHVQTPVEGESSRKRKAKEVSGGAAASPRPPIAVKTGVPTAPPVSVSALAVPHGVRPVAAAHPHVASAPMPHPHPPMMGYWGPPMMGPPTMIPGNPHMSWGTPVMGVPAGHHPPGMMAAHPAWAAHHFPGAAQIMSAPRPLALAAPASGAMAIAQPVTTTTAPVAQPAVAANKTEEVATSKSGPASPDMTKSDESNASGESEQTPLGMLMADGGDLVTIPEPSSPQCSEPESCFTSEPHPQGQSSNLDDINEEDYAFIDFALSDDFPACHEDEIVPPLNLSLKKSDSLLNLLNVQMVF